MNEDYILQQIKEWEDDMLEEYSELPVEKSECSVREKIITKLLEYSKIIDYYFPQIS